MSTPTTTRWNIYGNDSLRNCQFSSYHLARYRWRSSHLRALLIELCTQLCIRLDLCRFHRRKSIAFWSGGIGECLTDLLPFRLSPCQSSDSHVIPSSRNLISQSCWSRNQDFYLLNNTCTRKSNGLFQRVILRIDRRMHIRLSLFQRFIESRNVWAGIFGWMARNRRSWFGILLRNWLLPFNRKGSR